MLDRWCAGRLPQVRQTVSAPAFADPRRDANAVGRRARLSDQAHELRSRQRPVLIRIVSRKARAQLGVELVSRDGVIDVAIEIEAVRPDLRAAEPTPDQFENSIGCNDASLLESGAVNSRASPASLSACEMLRSPSVSKLTNISASAESSARIGPCCRTNCSRNAVSATAAQATAAMVLMLMHVPSISPNPGTA